MCRYMTVVRVGGRRRRKAGVEVVNVRKVGNGVVIEEEKRRGKVGVEVVNVKKKRAEVVS